MPSPFPGMDPYLEDPNLWPDFHLTFLIALRAALNDVLPPPFVARADRHVWVDAPEMDPRLLGRPDLYVADPLDAPPGSEAVTTLAAPVAAALPYPARKGQPFLKIVDARNHRVVTAVELLSPANKTPGRDRDAYLNKRADYLASQVNFVEMDLLRSGARAPVVGALPPADYYIIVCRYFDFPRAGVWPLTVRDRLPTIPIPLNPDVEPPLVQLRPSLDRAYDEAGYEREIDYTQPPTPSLAPTDAAWTSELLAGRAD
jgi:uncharacterized protein DUF4058